MNGGHFKLGLFVTVAVALLVAFLLMLGMLDRFKSKVMVETYFLESIQNLEPGAAVRFRGVKLGTVEWIGFAAMQYGKAATASGPGKYGSFIMVRLELYSAALSDAGVEDARGQIAADVEVGLRARLATTGLGGPTFVELDFLDLDAFPAPSITWTPEGVYIPSAPSTIVSIMDSLVLILRQVDELSLIDELATVSKDVQRVLEQIGASDLLTTTATAMQELQAASAEVKSLLDDPRLNTIIDDARATLEGARTLLESDRGKLETLVGDMTRMAGTLDRAGTSLDTLATTVNESDLIPQIETLAGELGPAGRDLSDLARRLDRLVKGNEQQISDAIRSLRDAVLELEAMLEDLKANPSRILGEPPPKRTPGGGS